MARRYSEASTNKMWRLIVCFAAHLILPIGAVSVVLSQPAMNEGDKIQDNPIVAPRESAIEGGQSDFLVWAKTSLIPISADALSSHGDESQALGQVIGNATVVVLSEALHGAEEPLDFRNRLLQYLVAEKGFTAIAIESGIVESRTVHDYVLGGAGDLPKVMAEGFSWTFDRLPQNQALVRWLRDYNADPLRGRKINFYGFDVSGSPGDLNPHRGVQTALVEALKYISLVDPAAGAAFHARIDSLLPSVRIARQSTEGSDYEREYQALTKIARDEVTAGINSMAALLRRGKDKYTSRTTTDDYVWAYRDAIAARQVDAFLRQTPTGQTQVGDNNRFLSASQDVRDRAQADNVDWIIKQEGRSGKVLVFAHRYHVSKAPVRLNWAAWQGQQGSFRPVLSNQQVMGSYLRQRVGGGRLVVFGNLVGSGIASCPEPECCAGVNESVEQAPPGSIDGLAGEVGTPSFVLDLRQAPIKVKKWLDQEHEVGRGHEVLTLPVGKAFDVLFYLDAVSPACELPGSTHGS